MSGMSNRTTDRNQPERDRIRPETDRHVVSAAVAAERLGLTPDAIRARIRRGTLVGEKRDGQWFVELPDQHYGDAAPTAPTGTRPDTDRNATADYDARLADKDAEIAYLRQLLDAEVEARRRADHLLAGALERLAALPATTSEMPIRDAPVARSEGSGGAESTSMAGGAGTVESTFWSRFWRALTGR
jgi:hypothetical protein